MPMYTFPRISILWALFALSFLLFSAEAVSLDPNYRSSKKERMDVIRVDFPSGTSEAATYANFIPLPAPIDCDPYTGQPGTMNSCFYFLNGFTDFITSMKVVNATVSGATKFVVDAEGPSPDNWYC